jgi:two-component system, NarL family, response regulator EvgA
LNQSLSVIDFNILFNIKVRVVQKRAFLIDDHDVIITMVRVLLRDMDVAVVGEARNGTEAIPMILETRPDLVMMDLSMPCKNGFEIAEELRAKGATCRYLIFTGVVATHAIERLHQMRFDGIVSKMSRTCELIEAIKAVLAGQSYCCALFKTVRAQHMKSANCPANILTRREVEVLSLIGEAKSDMEIARNLDLASSTVQGVRTSLIQKLALPGTPHLVRFAREQGYAEFAQRRVPKA